MSKLHVVFRLFLACGLIVIGLLKLASGEVPLEYRLVGGAEVILGGCVAWGRTFRISSWVVMWGFTGAATWTAGRLLLGRTAPACHCLGASVRASGTLELAAQACVILLAAGALLLQRV